MAKIPSPIITRWGGPHSDHPRIITRPRNRKSDLTLESNVLVQGFFSFHKHIYSYIATNGTAWNKVNCDLDVLWKGVKRFTPPPTRPEPFDIDSFFSPQRAKSVADINAIATASGAFTARRAVREGADCYRPWHQAIWKPLRGIIIDWLKKGKGELALTTKMSALDTIASVVYQNGIYKWRVHRVVGGRMKTESPTSLNPSSERQKDIKAIATFFLLMKPALFVAIVIVLLVSTSCSKLEAGTKELKPGEDYVPGKILFVFRDDVSEKEARGIIGSYGLEPPEGQYFPSPFSFQLLYVGADSESERLTAMENLVRELEKQSIVQFAVTDNKRIHVRFRENTTREAARNLLSSLLSSSHDFEVDHRMGGEVIVSVPEGKELEYISKVQEHKDPRYGAKPVYTKRLLD